MLNITLEKLVRLHVLDKDIQRVRAICNNIPLQVKKLEGKLFQLRRHLDSIKEKIKVNEKAIHSNEKEIENCRQQQGKYRTQLFKLKSNREYQALNWEIEQLSVKISDLETDILERMERIDAAKVEEKKAEERWNDEVKEFEKEKNKLMKELAAEKKELDRLEKEREMLSGDMEPEFLERYEKVKMKQGSGVADIIKGNCGGCFVRVRPQIAAMVRNNEQVLTCEKCGRFLFWSDQSEEK